MAKGGRHAWAFVRSFRARAFGWRSSRLACQRVGQAVREIRRVAKKDPVLAGEGAVRFLERVSPALEQVDSSSGSIGGAVNRALDALVPVIAAAPVAPSVRDAWLERLFEAYQDDGIPYIECLGERWGELCASPEVASIWAEKLRSVVTMAWADVQPAWCKAETPFLAALEAAGRHEELLALLETRPTPLLWFTTKFAVRSLAALGRPDEALALAEASRRGSWADEGIDAECERVLLAADAVDEAFERHAAAAHRRATFLATYREVAATYPGKTPEEVLRHLVASTPGEEGKWFAAAKDAGLFDLAIELARKHPADPHVLIRAARDHVESHPGFATAAAFLALRWIAAGHGYEITAGDAMAAADHLLASAERLGTTDQARAAARRLLAGEGPNVAFVRRWVGERLG